MSNRRAARESALKAIYAVEIGKSRTQDVTKNIIKADLTDDTSAVKFSEKLLLVTVDNAHEYDEIIQSHIKNWKVERLATLDKLILRMAISEFLHFEEVPTKVTINESIELAKEYSTRKSGNFVNGILDAVLNQLSEDGKITKKGRGLIESS
jgi:N utilization substance protein B